MTERTRFDEWLDAVGQTCRAFASEHGVDFHQAYYLAGIKSTRPPKSVSIRTLTRVGEATGIKPEVLLRDAMLVKPRPANDKPGPRPGSRRVG